MDCPKCATPCSDGAVECARCGVIFAKFEPRGAVSPGPPREGVERAQDDTVQRDPAADAISGVVRAARVLVLVVLVAWTWQFARAPMGAEEMASFIHLPNLVFHEAGHVIFSIFGRFATVLGGSLLQFLVPLILAGAFLRQRDPFGAVVCTWWAGQNLLDLAPYIADARALQLVLLGGKTGAEVEGHDWEFLLTEMGWLHLDRTLGLWTHRIGLTIMTAALAWGLVYLAREWRGSPARTLPGRAFE